MPLGTRRTPVVAIAPLQTQHERHEPCRDLEHPPILRRPLHKGGRARRVGRHVARGASRRGPRGGRIVSSCEATWERLASVTVVSMTGMSRRAGADEAARHDLGSADADPEAAGDLRPRTGIADTPERAGRDTTDSVASLYASERRALVRFGYLLAGDLGMAEDLVQDAFAALQPRWDRLADPATALGYVRVTMLNRSRTTFRRSALERSRSPRMLSRGDAPPDEVYLRDEEQRRVAALVARLPRRQREVVALRYWSDLTEAQIAASLGISPGTVKSTASRALAALARALDEEDSR